ncbi:MAG: signal peptidase I [Clostridia bacterium]|nr:signal peptidase I [Clostridia bacterium]
MNNEKKKPWSKVLSIICTVITAIILVLTAIIIVNIVICRAQHKPVSFFGTSFAIVQTNSMEPEIKVGDLIVYHSCKYADVEVGDYIVFVAGEGFDTAIKGQSVVHEAIAISENGITTKGVNNPSADRAPVTAENLLGKCTFNSAGWGAFFSFLSKYGIIIIIALIAIPFIVSQALKIVRLSKQSEEEKKAQTAIPQIEENAELPPTAEEPEDDNQNDI